MAAAAQEVKESKIKSIDEVLELLIGSFYSKIFQYSAKIIEGEKGRTRKLVVSAHDYNTHEEIYGSYCSSNLKLLNGLFEFKLGNKVIKKGCSSNPEQVFKDFITYLAELETISNGVPMMMLDNETDESIIHRKMIIISPEPHFTIQ